MKSHTPVDRLLDPRSQLANAGVRSSLNLSRGTRDRTRCLAPCLDSLSHNYACRRTAAAVPRSEDQYKLLNQLEKQIDEALYAHQLDRRDRRRASNLGEKVPDIDPELTQTALKGGRRLEDSYESLLRTAQRRKEKLRSMKERMRMMQTEFDQKCGDMDARIARYDREAETMREYKEKVREVLKEKIRQEELGRGLRDKEIELSEQLLTNKRLRDELDQIKQQSMGETRQTEAAMEQYE